MNSARPRVDLHCHTNRSDGLLPPRVLLEQMVAQGVSLAAITDHDTLAGYHDLAADRALGIGLPRIIPGVEINTIADFPGLPEGELHILGLGVNPDDLSLEVALHGQREARASRVASILEILERLGAPIGGRIALLPDDQSAVGRPHLARALVAAGHVTSFKEAFARYLSPGRPAYLPRLGMRTREAIDLILSSGGVPILAHFPLAPERPEVVAQLKAWGLMGLEVYYSKFTAAEMSAMAVFATQNGLLATAGTDYHGDSGTYADALATISQPSDLGERVLAALDGISAVA